MSLEYDSDLYASTFTASKLMRGLGHGATVTVLSDGVTKSELVSLQYQSGVWNVTGTESGSIGSFSGSQTSGNGWAAPGGQFSVLFTQGPSPQDGDLVDFVTTEDAGDADTQKKLYFGGARNTATVWNNGHSRLTIPSTGTFKAIGTPAYPTLIDWIDSNNTYYTLIASGAFITLQDFYIAHVYTH